MKIQSYMPIELGTNPNENRGVNRIKLKLGERMRENIKDE